MADPLVVEPNSLQGLYDGTTALGEVRGLTSKVLRWSATTSPAASYDTLTEALAAASSGDVVLLPPGTYSGDHTVPAGVVLTGNSAPIPTRFVGHITLGESTTLRDCLYHWSWSGWFWE